jgi:hypothetical protein
MPWWMDVWVIIYVIKLGQPCSNILLRPSVVDSDMNEFGKALGMDGRP